MQRTNVTEDDGRVVGWFDMGRAERWSDMDHNHNGSGGTGRGKAVIRTAQGRWVFEHWTLWQGDSSRYEYVTPDYAREWLIRNDEDDAVGEYFGEITEEEGSRPPGRPEEGERMEVRIPRHQRARLDKLAGESGTSRAEIIRRLLDAALD